MKDEKCAVCQHGPARHRHMTGWALDGPEVIYMCDRCQRSYVQVFGTQETAGEVAKAIQWAARRARQQRKEARR